MCNCIDCQLEREYGDNPPDDAIEALGGCRYCSMTGFEDYPRCHVPCRRGHKEPTGPYLPPLPEPAEGRPKLGNWKWTGRGWKNLNYVKVD